MNYPLDRLLIDPQAPDREAFSIHRPSSFCATVTFVTGGVNGKSPEDTALGNLADFSEYVPGVWELHGPTNELLATAEHGITQVTR
jgi:hypothetical protein